jgi:hypothetical protein
MSFSSSSSSAGAGAGAADGSSASSASSGIPANSASRALYAILLEDEASHHFKVRPDPLLYPDYYHAISKPIALADIQRSITGGRYPLHEMTRDLRRMISNAKKYNRPDAQVYLDALALEVRKSLGYGPGESVSCCSDLGRPSRSQRPHFSFLTSHPPFFPISPLAAHDPPGRQGH